MNRRNNGGNERPWHTPLEDKGWVERSRDGNNVTHENIETGEMVSSRQGRFSGREAYGICLDQWNKSECTKDKCPYKHKWNKADEPAIAEEFEQIRKGSIDKKERERIQALKETATETQRDKKEKTEGELESMG